MMQHKKGGDQYTYQRLCGGNMNLILTGVLLFAVSWISLPIYFAVHLAPRVMFLVLLPLCICQGFAIFFRVVPG